MVWSAASRQGAQVTGLSAFHRAGQTFLTWREVNPPDIPEPISVEQFKRIRTDLKAGIRTGSISPSNRFNRSRG